MSISLYRVSGQSNNTSPTWFKSTVEKFPLLNHLWSDVGWGECSSDASWICFRCEYFIQNIQVFLGKFTPPAHLRNTLQNHGTVSIFFVAPFHQGPYFLKWRSVLFPFSRSKASIGWLVSLEVRLFRRIFRPIGGFPHLAHKGLPKISVTGWWGRSPHVWRCFKDGRWGFAQSTHFFGMALQVLNAPFSVFIILHSWPQNS